MTIAEDDWHGISSIYSKCINFSTNNMNESHTLTYPNTSMYAQLFIITIAWFPQLYTQSSNVLPLEWCHPIHHQASSLNLKEFKGCSDCTHNPKELQSKRARIFNKAFTWSWNYLKWKHSNMMKTMKLRLIPTNIQPLGNKSLIHKPSPNNRYHQFWHI